MTDTSIRSRFFVTAILIAFATARSAHASETKPIQSPDVSKWVPGQSLTEKSREISHGFREVDRSEVNPPGGFEAVGHFRFVYYKQIRVCQCDAFEVAISPDGMFAIHNHDGDGGLALFRVSTGTDTMLTRKYHGTPTHADWDMQRKQIVVTLSRENGTITKNNKIVISLDRTEPIH